jgi:hypothetical protein
MKRPGAFISILCMSIFALLGVVFVRADDDLPKRSNFVRYQKMLDHSPFAVASAVALPASTPDFAKGLYVANAARTPDGDIVTIMSSDDKNLKEYLSTKQPNERGYGIASIEWSDRPGETKVMISKDGKFATLSFNQALLSERSPNPPAPGQPQPQPQPPSAPGGPGVNLPKLRASPLATQTPHVRGVIQRNPGAASPQQPVPEQ